MSAAVHLVLDAFQKREVERQLVLDLHLAQEGLRLLKMRIADIEIAGGSVTLSSLQTEHAEAAATYDLALQRFVAFVALGIVPRENVAEYPQTSTQVVHIKVG